MQGYIPKTVKEFLQLQHADERSDALVAKYIKAPDEMSEKRGKNYLLSKGICTGDRT